MKKKMLASLLLLIIVAFASFAEVRIYIKGALGYGYKTIDWERTYSYDIPNYTTDSTEYEYKFDISHHLFVATPVFGISPWWGSANAFLEGLSFEFSLEAGIGGIYAEYTGIDLEIDALSFTLNPKIMAVYSYRAGKIIPYSGIGFSVPIVFIPIFGNSPYTYSRESTSVSYNYYTPIVKAAFNANLMAGIGAAIRENIVQFLEIDFGFGFGSSTSVDIRAGFAYMFGKKKRAQLKTLNPKPS